MSEADEMEWFVTADMAERFEHVVWAALLEVGHGGEVGIDPDGQVWWAGPSWEPLDQATVEKAVSLGLAAIGQPHRGWIEATPSSHDTIDRHNPMTNRQVGPEVDV